MRALLRAPRHRYLATAPSTTISQQLLQLADHSTASVSHAEPQASTTAHLPDFSDTRKAFASKSSWELLRHLVVLRLCQLPALVRNADQLLDVSYKVLGQRVTNTIVRHTFFNHFVAGEDGDNIQPTLQRLHSAGIGSILDYAAEDDVETEGPPQSRTEPHDSVVARTYAYEDEDQCEKHTQVFTAAIDAAAQSPGIGFAAIKVTALGQPHLLERVSTQLTATRDLFRQFDADHDNLISLKEFKTAYEQMFVDNTEERMEQVFNYLDYEHKGQVDYVAWSKQVMRVGSKKIKVVLPASWNMEQAKQQVRVQDAPLIAARCKLPGPFSASVMTDEELTLLDALIQRVESLAAHAAKKSVRLMVDAEHTYFQPAIDHAVLQMQRQFNTEQPIVFNTYQCYLKDSYDRLLIDLERARREGFRFGAKLVRGAYMHLERQRAEELGYPPPIHDTIEATHDNYDRCVDKVLDAVKTDGAELMVASHNQRSIERALECMQRRGLAPEQGVYFGQLLGMADHLSYSLGAHSYKAYKYVPFGPLQLVMPYLIRRAQENSSVMGGAGPELAMIQRELVRRMGGGMLG